MFQIIVVIPLLCKFPLKIGNGEEVKQDIKEAKDWYR